MPESPKKNDSEKYRRITKNVIFWLAIFGGAMIVASLLTNATKGTEIELGYNQFVSMIEEGQIQKVHFRGKKITGEFDQSTPYTEEFGGKSIVYDKFFLYIPFEDPELLEHIRQNEVQIKTTSEDDSFMVLLFRFLPWLLIPLLYFFFIKQLRGSQKGLFTFGKSKAKLADTSGERVTFEDVAGSKEAKSELEEVVEYLKNPVKFARLGGKVPKGVLLLGAPGTGKTLLARAVAGEAGVPFYSMSGSDFVEMFVGVGASRVRDLFDTGKENAPCIIFIDEIDAVGRHRGAGLGGGHDEREQTLNQLLVEMDGFDVNRGIIVIASTNRPDILDPALLRPGRFDRRVMIDRPDVREREAIFKLHAKKIKAEDGVDFRVMAEMTPGLVGADIANIVNEAALLAARQGKEIVQRSDFDEAKDKALLGMERRTAVINPREREVSAYHEAGHALVAWFSREADPVRKVSIIPRGMALGVTYIAPTEDRRLLTRKYLRSQISMMLGGRAAELIIFEEPTSGAQNDIEKATELAHNMVCRWGMSEELGPLNYSEEDENIFLGKSITRRAHISEKLTEKVDMEVRHLIETGQKKAIEILRENLEKLHAIAQLLIKKETVDGPMLEEILGAPANGIRTVSTT